MSSMKIIDYNRRAAVAYARRWAFARNPKYYNFDKLGGDCTNFASQCIYAGAGVMNYTPVYGWFYITANNRTASWTGVEYLYNFLVGNKDGAGPFAEEVDASQIRIGDIIQLGRANGDFYHSPVVVGFRGGQPLIAAHTYDAYNRPINSYTYERIRYIHILGVRSGEE
ncbi:MAG: amidase domain-containing protein [Clostridia bacterium]|nr:amidase domain-containing protein [Clostridia bacterium]